MSALGEVMAGECYKSDAGVAADGKTRRRRLKCLALAIAAPVVVVLLLEAALRCAGFGYPVTFFVDGAKGQGCIPNDHFGRWCHCPETPDPFFLPKEKKPGSVRVFVVGESAAHGTPDPSFGVSRMLQVMLRDQFPGAEIEVFNTAMMGLNSHLIVPIARECARHEADVIVAYMGNNELIGSYGLNTAPAKLPPGLSLRWIRFSLWARSTKTGQLFDSVIGSRWAKKRAAEVQDEAFFLAHRSQVDDPQRRTVLENFRANVRDLCALGRDGKTHVVVSTVAVNLRDCPPFGSLHRPGLTAEQSNRWDAAYRRGIAMENSAAWADALRNFAEAEEIDPHFAELHFRQGRCHAAAGDPAKAREEFQMACDADAIPFRTVLRMNQIIRETATGPGVTLVDGERALAATSAGGIAGDDLFHEHVHFLFHGNYELARALFPSVAAAVGEKSKRAPRDPSSLLPESECARRLVFTPWEEIKLRRPIIKLFSVPPSSLRMENDRIMASAAAVLQKKEAALRQSDLNSLARAYAAAITVGPDDWYLRANFAELLAEFGRHDLAADQWRIVSRQFPCHLRFRHVLGVCLINAGDRAGAVRELNEILNIDPDNAAAKRLLAIASSGSR